MTIQEAPEITEEQLQAIVGSTSEIEPHFDALGVGAELLADALSITRGVGGVMLAKHIERTPDYQSWGAAGAYLGLSLTDLEGLAARWGRARQGKDESQPRPFQAWLDHLTDKAFADTTMAAIAKNELEKGNIVYGSTVAAAAGIITTRDVVTCVDRVVADAQGLDTRAQKRGKLKSIELYALGTVAVSPLAKNTAVRTLLGAGYLHAAKQSVESGISLHKSFKEQRSAHRVVRKAQRIVTKAVKTVLVDTSAEPSLEAQPYDVE